MTVDALSYLILSEPHALIAGATGSGKSTLLNTVLTTADALNYKYFIVDLKRVSVLKHKNKAVYYATEPPDALNIIDKTIDIMETRFIEMETAGKDETERPPFYLVVDETADLLDAVKKSYEKLKRVARLGRAAHVHLILCTQSPSRRVIPADLTLNIPCRVALRCESAIESRQILNRPGAETLPRYGYAIVKTPAGVDKWKVNKTE